MKTYLLHTIIFTQALIFLTIGASAGGFAMYYKGQVDAMARMSVPMLQLVDAPVIHAKH